MPESTTTVTMESEIPCMSEWVVAVDSVEDSGAEEGGIGHASPEYCRIGIESPACMCARLWRVHRKITREII